MKETLLMAVDLGTSFVKAGVYDTKSACIAQTQAAVKDYRPGPGIFIQKGDELYESVLECMRKAVAAIGDRAGNVSAISFTGQMSGFMGVSEAWEDITTWSCSLDSRYMPYAMKQMEQLRDPFMSISGTNFPQMASKYEWFANDFPQEAKKIAKCLMISGYVIGRLGNIPIEEAVMDRTYASWTGLADVRNDSWSKEICEKVGIPMDLLPKIVNSNYICGYLCENAAKQVGLKSGIPLVSGAGDKMAGCLGSAAVSVGDSVFEASSYGEISCCVDQFRVDMEERRFDVLASAVPGKFFATHFAAGSGITLDWFVNTFVSRPGDDLGEVFAQLDEKVAKLTPGCDGVMAIGLLAGSSMPLESNLKGMWIGYDWSHKPEHFYRALLESFTYDFALAADRIDKTYSEYDFSRVKMIGGGANSSVWPQMSADVTGKTYCTLNRKDVSMWGASILAGNAIGVFPSIEETARQYVQEKNTFTPNMEMHEKYKKYMALYKDYIEQMVPFHKRIADLMQED